MDSDSLLVKFFAEPEVRAKERDRNAVECLSENREAGRTLLTDMSRRRPEVEGGRIWRGLRVSDVARRAEEEEEGVTGPRIDGGVGDRPARSVAELAGQVTTPEAVTESNRTNHHMGEL